MVWRYMHVHRYHLHGYYLPPTFFVLFSSSVPQPSRPEFAFIENKGEADWVSADILHVFELWTSWSGLELEESVGWIEKARSVGRYGTRCHAIYPERLITKPQPRTENKPISLFLRNNNASNFSLHAAVSATLLLFRYCYYYTRPNGPSNHPISIHTYVFLWTWAVGSSWENY